MRFAILNILDGATFSKTCTAYKNDLLGGVGENQATSTIPIFILTPFFHLRRLMRELSSVEQK